MTKQYGKLEHKKACDYIMVVNSCMGSEPSLMIIQFYAAVALGLDRYYMSDKHPTVLSEDQREKARAIIKQLPPGWMRMPHRWDLHQ